MLTEVRLKAIAEYIAQHGNAETSELSKLFMVSEMTIRRDLKKLEAQGIIQRTHGGAIRTTLNGDTDISVRMGQNAGLKSLIAKRAVQLIAPHETILIDVGSTMRAIADALPNDAGIVVVTNGAMILTELMDKVGVEVLLLGGVLQRVPQLFMGPTVVEHLRTFKVDKAFIAASAISESGQVMDSNIYQSEIKRYMMQAARERILVVDSTKIGHVSLHPVAMLEDFDMLIVDDGADMRFLNRLRRNTKPTLLMVPTKSQVSAELL
jgi:DeoR family transcriptional regulator of aga operon